MKRMEKGMDKPFARRVPSPQRRVWLGAVVIAMLLAGSRIAAPTSVRAAAQSAVPVDPSTAPPNAVSQNAVHPNAVHPNAVAQNGVNPADPNPGYTPTENKLLKKVAPIRPSPADVALSAYIARVHANYQPEEPTLGSLWIPNGRLTTFSADFRARRLHDVISVVVSESLTAETDGTVKNQRASSMSSAISSLFGTLGANNRLQNLLNTNAASALTAQGQSVSNSSLSTTLGGEVVDVLPNGMLVIQAVRQVTFSQQTQTIRLRGVVRPEDVNVLNQVQSTAITNLELEVLGRGIINDYTYRPNLLVRLVQRLLVF